ncbi:DUF4157 domain-containing protein [Streptomyces sp. TRM 70361]|uniref:eCIS core domain-containing protein n=1 Tax=Streptomyces sp. TRM 70361 TaxID=3116553 RepID=UPI002E7B0F31|nr:DUF4157 domain-containing protein [Streptomyces sp. TRM 70361]MEE1941259.1 DUF4157 domain-containing protein [Streptomyces sp. TRM 70361]
MRFEEKSEAPAPHRDRAPSSRPRRAVRQEAPEAATPHPRSPAALTALQRAVGNAAVVQLLAEQEQGQEHQEHQEHRHGAECGHQPPVQRSSVEEVLRSPGTPLEPAKRAEMETRLGADFSAVRIHTDAVAQRSAAELRASAWTSGNDIAVGRKDIDDHTLAHELAHVIQQNSGPVDGTAGPDGVRVSDPGDRFEQEAEATAAQVMAAPLPEVGPTPADGPPDPAAAGSAVQLARHTTGQPEHDPDGDD